MSPGASDSLPARVVLVGQMGAGKTTVGRRLAASLGYRFVDNDEALEHRAGRSAAQLQRDEGVDALHRLESQVLTSLLDEPGPVVIAAPASAVDTVDAEPVQRASYVVWLSASPEVLAERSAQGAHRPLPAEHRVEHFERLATKRDDRLCEMADLIVDVGELEPDAAVAAVLDALRHRS